MIPNALVKEFRKAKNIVAFTGAGISAESGIPTFRGSGGLWEGYRVEEVASPDGFNTNPVLVWKFYDERRKNIFKAVPNTAHTVLAKLENYYNVWIITQNIDGLHIRAGSTNVIELHGNIWRVRCTSCNYKDINEDVPLKDLPPKCPECGSLLRPDVVLFGEPVYDLEKAFHVAENCDIMMAIGTSAQVYPAAYLPLYAKQHGAIVININPERTPVDDYADFSIHAKATEALSSLYQKLQEAFQEE